MSAGTEQTITAPEEMTITAFGTPIMVPQTDPMDLWRHLSDILDNDHATLILDARTSMNISPGEFQRYRYHLVDHHKEHSKLYGLNKKEDYPK